MMQQCAQASETDALRLATSIEGKSWSDTTTVVMDDLASCNYREEKERPREEGEREFKVYTRPVKDRMPKRKMH